MSNENKIEFCKCSELAEKLEASVKDNERLAETIRELRQEIEVLQSERRSRSSDYKSQINHGWKKDYEELQMRYEILSGEKRLLEDEERKLKRRINELEKRQKALESEIARLTAELDACKTLEQVFRERRHHSENGYLSERGGIPRHRVQFTNPHHQVYERWRIQEQALDSCIPDSLTKWTDTLSEHT